MEKKLKVGVVGCGEIAQIAHIPYLNELPQFEVAAICDISPKVLDGVGDLFGVVERYLDHQEMINRVEMDAVLVCCHDHLDSVVTALNAGKHVMVEKPLAFNLEQADQMLEAAEENNRKLMVAYMKRYDPAFEWALPQFNNLQNIHLIRMHDFAGGYQINQEIYNLIKPIDISQDIWDAVNAEMKNAKILAIGKENADLVDAYNTLLYLCSHDSIVLHEAFGSPTRILHVEVYRGSFVLAILEYGQGTRCVWESGLVMDISDWDEQLIAYSAERRIEVKFPFPYLKNEATLVNINEMEGGVNIQKRALVSYDEAFKREWRHFYDCVVHDDTPITSGEKGKRDIAFLIDLIKNVRRD